MTSGAHRGPALPYSTIAGVTPCASGWLIAKAKLHGPVFAPEDPIVVPSFTDVLDQRPSLAVTALDATIGQAKGAGERTCDRQARALLGRKVPALVGAPGSEYTEEPTEMFTDRLDAVGPRLLARQLEVMRVMAPYRQRTVYEVLPELTFYQLNGDEALCTSMGSEQGRVQRRALLEARMSGVLRILDANLGVPSARLLDAAACLYTARRIAGHSAQRLPAVPEWDDRGMRMEIFR